MNKLDVIYNENCLEGLSKIESGSVDAIITDPPYALGMSSNGIKTSMTDLTVIQPFFSHIFKEFARILKKDGYCYTFCDWRTYVYLALPLNQHLTQRNCIVWDRGTPSASSWYMFCHEFIVFAVNGTVVGCKQFLRNNHFDIKKCARVGTNNRLHRAQKPVDLICDLILDSTNENEVVLDPFMGSGTTAVAAKQLNRHYIGFELDPHFYEVCLNRLENTQTTILS